MRSGNWNPLLQLVVSLPNIIWLSWNAMCVISQCLSPKVTSLPLSSGRLCSFTAEHTFILWFPSQWCFCLVLSFHKIFTRWSQNRHLSPYLWPKQAMLSLSRLSVCLRFAYTETFSQLVCFCPHFLHLLYVLYWVNSAATFFVCKCCFMCLILISFLVCVVLCISDFSDALACGTLQTNVPRGTIKLLS